MVTVSFEFLCFTVYFCDLLLLWLCFGWKRFKNLWPGLRLLILVVMVADTITFIGSGYTSFHLSRAARPLMLIARLRNVRKMLSGCVVTSFRIYGVFLLLAFHVVFFSLLGYLLFGNDSLSLSFFGAFSLSLSDSLTHVLFVAQLTPKSTTFRSCIWLCTTYSCCPPASHSVRRSATLFRLSSVCLPFRSLNFLLYSDLTVMLPYWELSRWSGLFFIAFVLTGNLGVFKLIIAVSYKTYKLYVRDKLVDRLSKRKIALSAAFKRLSVNGYVSCEAWVKVMKELRPKLPDEVVRVLFQSVDTERTGHVGLRAFLQLCSMVDVTFDDHTSSWLSVWLTARWPRLQHWRDTGRDWLRYKIWVFGEPLLAVQAIVMVFVVLSATQLVMVARSTNISEAWSIVGAVLLAVFMAEVSAAFGCDRQLSHTGY
jgi:hypothetical protein